MQKGIKSKAKYKMLKLGIGGFDYEVISHKIIGFMHQC